MSEKKFAEIFSQWEQKHKIINKDYNKIQINNQKNKDNIPTIDLHGLTQKQAINNLKKFVLQNRSKKVKIIHGAGIHSQGGRAILKNVVKEWLVGHPNLVKSFRPASIGEGRYGATIAYLY